MKVSEMFDTIVIKTLTYRFWTDASKGGSSPDITKMVPTSVNLELMESLVNIHTVLEKGNAVGLIGNPLTGIGVVA